MSVTFDKTHLAPLPLIVVGSYDTDVGASYSGEPIPADSATFFDASRQVIRVVTSIGKLWVPLMFTGIYKNEFCPDREMVLVFILDRDYVVTSSYDGTSVLSSDYGFGMIVNKPPQLSPPPRPETIKASMPTKVIDGTSSELTAGYEINSGGVGIHVSDGAVQIKSDSADIRLGKTGIVERGSRVSLDFFNESKGGILKQNWIAHLVPTTVVTPFPMYLPDERIATMIKNVADAISDFKSVR